MNALRDLLSVVIEVAMIAVFALVVTSFALGAVYLAAIEGGLI